MALDFVGLSLGSPRGLLLGSLNSEGLPNAGIDYYLSTAVLQQV